VAVLMKLQSMFVGSLILLSIGVVPYAFSQTQIIGGAKERQPSYGELENFRILSYSDLDGWDQPLSSVSAVTADTPTPRTIKAPAS
jgi:hypothetical protein